MLYVISHSLNQIDSESILRMVTEQDMVLFVQDGVTITTFNNSLLCGLVKQNINISVLQEDLLARGLLQRVHAEIKIINYDEYVDLSIDYSPQQCW